MGIWRYCNFVSQITKQLEKDSIKWTVEENGLTVRVQADIIDRKSLSFAKKNWHENHLKAVAYFS